MDLWETNWIVVSPHNNSWWHQHISETILFLTKISPEFLNGKLKIAVWIFKRKCDCDINVSKTFAFCPSWREIDLQCVELFCPQHVDFEEFTIRNFTLGGHLRFSEIRNFFQHLADPGNESKCREMWQIREI